MHLQHRTIYLNCGKNPIAVLRKSYAEKTEEGRRREGNTSSMLSKMEVA